MGNDDGRGALLGMELVGLAHDDADARSVQQAEDVALVGEIYQDADKLKQQAKKPLHAAE